jgi:hypothetical protein
MLFRDLYQALQLNMIRRFACRLIGPERFAALDDHCRQCYRSQSYWYGFWCEALSGKRIVCRVEAVEADEEFRKAHPLCGGRKLVERDVYQHASMTKEEFYARFPYLDPPESDPAPVEDGLVEYLDRIFAQLKAKAG